MPKQPSQPLAPKRLVQLFDGDREELARFHPKLSFSEAVRLVISSHVKRLRELDSRQGDTNATIDLGSSIAIDLGDN